jgi:hypothetical protein
MRDYIETLRLRLEQILGELGLQEAAGLRFDPNLLTEMTYLVRYFRERKFTLTVVREGQSLSVRIERQPE